MKVWLTQRAEPTPHDQLEQRRPMRTGLMAEYLSNQGENVLWWTGDYDHYGQHQRRHGSAEIPVTETYKIRYLDAPGYTRAKSIARLRYDRKVAQEFTALAQTYERPDVILASMPSVDLTLASIEYGKANNVPVIVDIRDLYPDVIVEAAPKLVRSLAHLATRPMKEKVAAICRDATAIWGNSDAFVEWGCSLGARKRGELDFTVPIAYKPLAVDRTETANIQQVWQADGLFKPEHLNIVFFGSLSKAFDFGPVFEVAKWLDMAGSSHRFHIFGAGQQEGYIAGQCASLSNSTFHGPVGAAKLQAAMALSDIGLAPYVFTDNFAANMPNKTTEYLGGGLIVGLAFKTGVLAEFLKVTGSGFFYDNAAELLKALTALEQNPERTKIARQAAAAAFEAHLGYETLSQRMHDKIKATVESAIT